MDAAFLLVFTIACLLAWLVAITDKTTPTIYRVVGILFGVPATLWYFLYIVGQTRSPMWNDIGGGPVAVVALGLGLIAFLSRPKTKKPPADSSAGLNA